MTLLESLLGGEREEGGARDTLATEGVEEADTATPFLAPLVAWRTGCASIGDGCCCSSCCCCAFALLLTLLMPLLPPQPQRAAALANGGEARGEGIEAGILSSPLALGTSRSTSFRSSASSVGSYSASSNGLYSGDV